MYPMLDGTLLIQAYVTVLVGSAMYQGLCLIMLLALIHSSTQKFSSGNRFSERTRLQYH
jgi:hypothetical protein